VNSFDLLRLLAAVSVLYFHVYPLTGRPIPTLFATNYGELGVAVFFVVSGYLVTASWRRSAGIGDYLKKRLLRIEPALVVSLAVTALVLGAFATTLPLADYFRTPQVWLYIARNALLYPVTYDLPGVFAHNPFPHAVNGSLWTLRLEFSCYLALALLGLCRVLTPKVVAGLAVVAAVAFVVLRLLRPDLLTQDIFRLAELAALNGFLFLGGAWLQLRDRPPPLWLVVVSVPLLFTPLWLLGLPAIVIALGSLRSPKLPADISYGLYIYAFPLQQILAAAGWLNVWTALAATLPFAIASWFLVEKPALRLKSRSAVPLATHLASER
jgi:peptidoglycan/LPS O-acetylase OafA/YrhL